MDNEINNFDDLKNYKVEINTYKMRIEDFLSASRFILQPEFQRDYVWDDLRASLLIETILLGLPIPAIFTYINLGNGKEPVIDGQQRLFTIKRYFNNDFKLKALPRLKFLNGLSYFELPNDFKSRLKLYMLNITCLNNIANKKIIYDVFQRFNTGGMKLNPQEIRNCIYGGQYNDFLKDLAKDKGFLKLMNKFKPKRFLLEELAVRFFSLYDNLDKYKGNMNLFINQYYENKDYLNNFSKVDFQNHIKEYKNTFIDCVNACEIVFGQFAFRNLNIKTDEFNKKQYSFGSFSKHIFDLQMMGFANIDLASVNRNSAAIKEKFINIILNDKDMQLDTKNNNKFTAKRIRKWQDCIRKIINE